MDFSPQPIRFCTSSDGVRIAYTVAGTGPPLVRVANWLTHAELDQTGPVWSHWFEELSQSHTLICYDIRGSGLSSRAVDELSIDAWVRDLEAVVDDVGLDRFPIVGLCQGGVIAAAYAARHPHRVSRLVIHGGYTRGYLVDDATPAQRREAETLAKMIEVGWGRRHAAFRQVFVNLLMPNASEKQQRWLAELERKSASTGMAVRLWRSFHAMDIRDVAPRVETPALFFHVRDDAMVPFDAGRRFASLLPDARFIPLEGANHVLLADKPAWHRFVRELRRFLGSDEHRSTEAFSELTPREREVLDLIAQGKSNRQIAEELCISPKTVRNHITHIFSKLQVSRRAEAIVRAREAQFGRNGR